MSETVNLKLWNEVSKTDPDHTKKVTFGRKFTAIDPTYQTHMATKLWGPQGVRWGLKDLVYTRFESTSYDKDAKKEFTETSMMLTATLVFPSDDGSQGTVPVAADMKFRAGDDVAKKLRTQCKSKALAELGFGADVFLGLFDDAAYVADAETRFGDQEQFRSKAMVSIKTAANPAALAKCKDRADKMLAGDTISASLWQELNAAIVERSESLCE